MARKSNSNSESTKSPGSFVLFVRRLSFFGIILTLLALVYTIMGGDPQYLAGTQTDGDGIHTETTPVQEVQTHQTQKPTMGLNIFRFISDSTQDTETVENTESSAETESESESDTEMTSETDTQTNTETSSYDSNYDSGSSDSLNGYSENNNSDVSNDYSNNYGDSYSSPPGNDSIQDTTSDNSSNSESYSENNTKTDSASPMMPSPSQMESEAKQEIGNSSASETSSMPSETPPSTSPLVDFPAVTEEFSTESAKNPSAVSTHGAVITGPDGVPRCGEVMVQEVGLPNLKNLEGPPVTNFLELFSFDITPEWVEARWSNITIVGPLTTRGYRVPLSTGPTDSDLVGSLTYYFNNRLELEKITFEGYTGSLDRLVISLQYFNMSKRVTSDPNALLYLSESLADNRVSFLKSYHRLLPLEEGNPMKKYWITMELYPPER